MGRSNICVALLCVGHRACFLPCNRFRTPRPFSALASEASGTEDWGATRAANRNRSLAEFGPSSAAFAPTLVYAGRTDVRPTSTEITPNLFKSGASTQSNVGQSRATPGQIRPTLPHLGRHPARTWAHCGQDMGRIVQIATKSGPNSDKIWGDVSMDHGPESANARRRRTKLT